MNPFVTGITAMMIGALFTLPNEALAADDISHHWSYKSVQKMQQLQINEFKITKTEQLDLPITRAKISDVLSNFVDPETLTVKLKATDLPTNYASYNSMRLLVQKGIIQNSDKLRPNDFLTKAEAARLIALTFNINIDMHPSKKFRDVAPTNWAYTCINTLADVGIVKGNTKLQFQPTSYVTTAELASLLNETLQFNENISDYKLVYDEINKDYLYTENKYASFEQEIIYYINEYRVSKGLSPLKYDPKLTQLALIKVNDMIQNHYFDHFSPTYRMPWELAGQFHYEFQLFGENLAKNFVKPKDVVQAWVASPSHNENLLKKGYENVGIGIRANEQGYFYFSSLFSGK